jgi:hypothetical protein
MEKMNSTSNETKNLTAILMLEIIGRPAEHLTETLNDIVTKMDAEPRVTIKEKKIAEPKEVEEQKDFFSSFAEIEVEVEGILDLVVLCFKYMPAHVEVVNPELIAVTNNSWSDILSEIVRKLHGYEEVTRVLQNERNILESKLKEVLEEKAGKEEKGKVSKKEEKK